jgi:hypothetical protein
MKKQNGAALHGAGHQSVRNVGAGTHAKKQGRSPPTSREAFPRLFLGDQVLYTVPARPASTATYHRFLHP